MRKGSRDDKGPGYQGGVRAFGKQTYVNKDNQRISYIYDPVPVPFNFYIGKSDAYHVFKRDVSEVTLVDTLPTYQAYNSETGEIETRRAVFNAANNPGWVYNDSDQTVTFVKSYNPKRASSMACRCCIYLSRVPLLDRIF